jgi:TolB protein
MKRHLFWVAVAVAIGAPTACSRDEVTGVSGLSASRNKASNTLDNVIVFNTKEPGTQPQLAVINPDGSGRQVLTNDPQHAYLYPAVSPNGRRIAFARFDSDNASDGLFLVNADGSGQALLIHHSSQFDGEPAWSPDGSQIAFMSLDESAFGPIARIYVVNVDGSGVRQLSPPIDEQTEYAFDEGPTWSPDGTRIAFTRNAQLYVINADGTNLTALPNEDFAVSASWSPDGTRIAYTSLVPFGEVHIRNADGSHLVTLTTDGGGPRWSADGNRLVFLRSIGGRPQMFVINADGTGEARLSFGTLDDQSDWSHFPPRRSDGGASIVIVPTNAKVAPGETRQFTATVRMSNGNVLGNAPVAWSSSDPAVATVTSSGVVTALTNGTAQIRAAFGSGTAGALVRVADHVLRNSIVYSTDEFGAPEFAVVKPDGTARRRLTADQLGLYRSPDISPDGTRIVFTTDFSIFVMSADAAGLTEGFTEVLTDFAAHPRAAAWSPDGSQIAFTADVQGPFGPEGRIYVVNADGSGRRQVSPDDPQQSPVADDGATWSPDGTRLVFTRNGVLQSISVDGTGLTTLASDDPASSPDWSPDGTRVVYASVGFGIRIRNADGSNPVAVTTGTGDSHPRWAPDNQRLVFARLVDGRSQLFIINADGTGETRLSTGTGQERDPSWSPVP